MKNTIIWVLVSLIAAILLVIGGLFAYMSLSAEKFTEPDVVAPLENVTLPADVNTTPTDVNDSDKNITIPATTQKPVARIIDVTTEDGLRNISSRQDCAYAFPLLFADQKSHEREKKDLERDIGRISEDLQQAKDDLERAEQQGTLNGESISELRRDVRDLEIDLENAEDDLDQLKYDSALLLRRIILAQEICNRYGYVQ